MRPVKANMKAYLKAGVDLWLRRAWKPSASDGTAQLKGARPVALVTGATGGIGQAFAELLAARGHDLLLIARSAEDLEALAGKIRTQHHNRTISTLPLDLTAPDALDQLDAKLTSEDAYVDLLVNNAAIGLAGEFTDAPSSNIDTALNLNMAAATALMRSVLPGMLARGRGGIINMASLGGLTPGPYQSVYYASKAFVISLSRAIAWEIRGRGVRLCVVAPGPVETKFHERMGAESALYRTLLPALSPHRVAKSALFGYDWGRTMVVPGLINRATALALHVLPASLMIPLIAILLRPRV